MTLCDDCQRLSDGWLDYRIEPTMKIASGASRDDTPAGVKDALAARHEQWRNTVRTQQDLIRRMCVHKHWKDCEHCGHSNVIDDLDGWHRPTCKAVSMAASLKGMTLPDGIWVYRVRREEVPR